MYNLLLKVIALTVIMFVLTGCNGSEESEDEISNVQELEFELDRPLSDNNPATKVSATQMKGISPYSDHNMWGLPSISHYSTSTKHFYVAPQCEGTEVKDVICGLSSNDGTKDSPWDFYGAINGDYPIPPNSVVWMKAGEYKHPNARPDKIVYFEILISGTTNKPIHFRAEDGNFDGVKVNSGVNIKGDWVWLWDIEMTYVREPGEVDRYDELTGAIVDDWRPNTISPIYYFTKSDFAVVKKTTKRLEVYIYESADNCKVINTRAHKLVQGMYVSHVATNIELYGNIIYDNGWVQEDRGHGHGLYLQNSSVTKIIVSDNIIAGNMGEGMQIYSTIKGNRDNIDVIGNIFFAARNGGKVNNRSAVGNRIVVGFQNSKNLYFNENYMSSYGVIMPYAISVAQVKDENGTRIYVTPDDRECKNNIFYKSYTSEAFDCDREASNTIYSSYYPYELPQTHSSYLRPNKYDGRRANLVVINPNQEEMISVNLGTFAKEGDKIMIFNPFDMSNPIEYGRYNGKFSNIHWPETSWDLTSFKSTPDNNMKKEFWAFVIVNLGQ